MVFDKDIGIGKRLIGEKWSTPLVFSLSPEMNPIGIGVTYSSGTFSKSRKAYYTAQLKLGDEEVWTKRFKITARVEGGRKTVNVFSVKEASELYVLDIKEEGDKLAVGRLVVKIRSNVQQVKKIILIPACLLLIISSILLKLLISSPRKFGQRLGNLFRAKRGKKQDVLRILRNKI